MYHPASRLHNTDMALPEHQIASPKAAQTCCWDNQIAERLFL
jgi:hypothetical protein